MRARLGVALLLAVLGTFSTVRADECELLPPGEPCLDDGNPCTLDLCGPAMTCEHQPGNAGTPCRSSAGSCDPAESCDGVNADCPPDVLGTSECRGSAGPCDPAESCDGANPDCPPDVLSTSECRGSAGPCDPAESCDGINPGCPPDVLSTSPCRGSAGPCDPAESCDGVNPSCPADVLSTGPCRASAGLCDPAESCDGISPDCPPDLRSTGECRGSAGLCDPAETCDGVSPDCPPDERSPANAPCRLAVGQCDLTELCDGFAPTCPPDAKSTEPCRGTAGECDLVERCDGVGNACPPDGFSPSTLECRPADEQCDQAEHCSGFGPDCPADLPAPDQTSCDDADSCTSNDRCIGGVCGGTAIPGCCTGDADCDDGYGCTLDRCLDSSCASVPLDERCDPGEDCSRPTCAPGEAGASTTGCVFRSTNQDAYCTEDANPCTVDFCSDIVCAHQSDGSGPGCANLLRPFTDALVLATRADELLGLLAPTLGCGPGAGETCNPGTPSPTIARLLTLIDSAGTDLEAGVVTLAGRIARGPAPDATRNPLVRARVTVGLIGSTPPTLRTAVFTLNQARRQKVLEAAFARARRKDARQLLRGTKQLRRQLRRMLVRRLSFDQ